MRLLSRTLVFAAALLALAGTASAQPTTLKIDTAHSEVGFKIRHFFSKVYGNFSDFSGTIVYDDKNLAASTVEITIRDTSINTGNGRRDGHLRTDEFFWTEKYPHITFKSTKVVPGEDPNHFQVLGDLTIRDVTKPVVLEAELIGIGPQMVEGQDWGTRAGFSAATQINRKDFGIVWNKTLDAGGVMLGEEVEIVLNLEAGYREKKPEAPAAATAPKVEKVEKKK